MPEPEPHQRVSVRVEGRVQGVGFRYFTQTCARSLNLTGWVRNAYDGSVEAVAEGPPGRLERFVSQLREGPRSSRVDRVTVDRQDAGGEFTDFSVRH